MPIQGPQEALAKVREWDALSEARREEFSRSYVEDRKRFDDWLAWLRSQRWKHAAYGALTHALPATFVLGTISTAAGLFGALVILADAAAGAAAGYALNALRGGEYRGMLAFGGVYAGTTVAKVALGALLNPLELGGFGAAGPLLFLFCSFLISLVAGYLFGLNLTLERSMR